MSYGCINLLPEDFEVLHSYLKEGQKVYVLPEEKGNELKLENVDGEKKFVQKYHTEQKLGTSVEEASKVYYDVNISAADSVTDFFEGIGYWLYNKIR